MGDSPLCDPKSWVNIWGRAQLSKRGEKGRQTAINRAVQWTSGPLHRNFIHGPLTRGGSVRSWRVTAKGRLQCEAGGPAKAAPSTRLGHISLSSEATSKTVSLQIISLRKTGHFIEQKRNTNVCKPTRCACGAGQKFPWPHGRPGFCPAPPQTGPHVAGVQLFGPGSEGAPKESQPSNQANHLVNLSHVDAL